MNYIDSLNRRFAEALGTRGSVGRYSWQHTRDLFYYPRAATGDFVQRCWAGRMGRAWVLCERRFPVAAHPHPEQMEWFPYDATALPDGMEPTLELTLGYIRSVRDQMERAELAIKAQCAGRKDVTTEQCEAEAQKTQDQADQNFYDSVADWEPMSWKLGEAHNPGDQDGPVSFGGIASPAKQVSGDQASV